MKLSSVHLQKFKRFADLRITGLPQTAHLVVVAGPNGFGKSSLFDAFSIAAREAGGLESRNDPDYYRRRVAGTPIPVTPQPHSVAVAFHGAQPRTSAEWKKAFYFRSAYRNDPELSIKSIGRLGPAVDERRFERLIDTDTAVTGNYQRMVAASFEDAFEREDAATTIGAWREGVVRELRDAMLRLFPGLTLDSLGNPIRDPTFRFTKGATPGFVYKNLSGGEKAAFDLLLDLFVKRREYDATVFCIDEPEIHLNPRLHGPLLAELLAIVPESSQLWVATHSVGMLRRARDIDAQRPGSVAFLDFEGHDFDAIVQLAPLRPTRAFWSAALAVALDDLADLVAPRELVVCEGNPAGAVPGKNADHDARCYSAIFAADLPDVAFVSGGNSHDVAGDRFGVAAAFPTVVKGTRVSRLIDRDDHAPADVAELGKKGVTVLSRRNIEAYLYDDEVLRALCEAQGHAAVATALLAEKATALAASAARGNAADDLKPAAPAVYAAAKRLLGLVAQGNDARAFERNILAPLVASGTTVHKYLRRDIFGDAV
jgi:hypothetical protein